MSTRAAAKAFGLTWPSGFNGGSFLDKMVMSSRAAGTSSSTKASVSTVIREGKGRQESRDPACTLAQTQGGLSDTLDPARQDDVSA